MASNETPKLNTMVPIAMSYDAIEARAASFSQVALCFGDGRVLFYSALKGLLAIGVAGALLTPVEFHQLESPT